MKAAKVKNAYMKKKDPLFVRESLLNAAFELAATKGMGDVTVNKVSELADVTKGALKLSRLRLVRHSSSNLTDSRHLY